MKKMILSMVLTVGLFTAAFAQDSTVRAVIVLDTTQYKELLEFMGDIPTKFGTGKYYDMVKNYALIKVPLSSPADKPKK